MNTRSRRSAIFWFLSLTAPLIKADISPSQWRIQKLPAVQDLQMSKIVFANDRLGWIIAGANTLLKSVDGGKNWSIQTTNLAKPHTEVSGLWFVDENRGWAVGA